MFSVVNAKHLFFLVFLFIVGHDLLALEITVSNGITKQKPYSILNITNQTDFECKNLYSVKNPVDRYLCSFDKVPISFPTPSENSFFAIKPLIKNEKLFILITPKEKSILKKYNSKKKLSSHWIIVGYINNPPFISKPTKIKEGLNFDISIKNDMPYFVDSLDIDRKPLNDKKAKKSINDFLKIKKLYEEKKYERVIQLANIITKKYPNSIFLPEILAYEIRSLDEMKKYIKLIDIAKIWIETYTTHEDLPEMMLLGAKAYLETGNTKKADYYIDLLIRDYEDSIYSQLATIYKAKRLESMVKEAQAMVLYRKVLNHTKDIDIASIAASKLARLLLKHEKAQEGINYYKKIYSANPSFFTKENPLSAYDLAIILTRYNEFGFCAALGDLTLAKLNKDDNNYKNILISSARWHAKAGEIEKAKEKYERFFKEFPYDEMEAELKEEYDKLFFEMNDLSVQQKLKKYDELIKKYGDSEVGNKAFYEKIMLLAKNNRFDEIKNKLGEFMSLSKIYFPDIDIDSKQIVNNMFFYYLMADKCKDVVEIYKNFEVNIDAIYDEKIYNCMIKEYKYDLASQLADKNIYNTSGLFTIKWLGKKLDIYYKTSNFKKATQAGDDYIKSMKLYNQKISYKRYKEIIDANYMQKNYMKVLKIAKTIELLYPKAIDIADVYKIAIKASKKIDNINSLLYYAKKLYNYQEKTNTLLYSPWIEIEYSKALMKTKRYKEAINILQVLAANKKLSNDKKAKVLYELSTALDNKGYFNLSKKVLQKCIKIEGKSVYKRLCSDSLKIYENSD